MAKVETNKTIYNKILEKKLLDSYNNKKIRMNQQQFDSSFKSCHIFHG